MIHLDRPIWLLALLAVPLIVLLGRRATAAVRGRQFRAATWLRAGAVALLVVALAGPRWEQAGRAVDVAFLVDDSDSVGISSSYAVEWVRDAIAAMRPEDRAAMALFGADARIEHTLRPDPPLDEVATVVDGSGTDIERALRLAQGVLGSEQRRRVVLFTDGRPTEGDAVRAARELAESGVSVDVVPLASGRAADVLIASVDAPTRVRDGESFDIRTTLRNTGDAAAEVVVVVTADGEEVDRRTVTAEPGDTELTLAQTAEEGGTVRYEVRLASGASTIPENDVARTAVQVQGPPKVLVFEGHTGDGEDLARALASAGVPADRISAEEQVFPPLDRLLDYDSVLLVDVPADVLGTDGMVALDAFVRDAGHGVVAIGGPNSFGMGGYDATPLEDLLPVFARVKDPKRRPSVAEALVVDVSGSMAACHCRPDGFAGGPGAGEEGGVNKTDITREAVARAVRALEAQDTVGVLAFNAESKWVVPLQQLPDEALVDEALARLHPDGPTDVVTALNEAVAGLKDQEARLRHIVLFTDGFSEDPAMVEAARNAAENGITLSVVATGEGTGEVLRRMAEAGGGRFYPGRDLFSIPDIIVSEVQFAARPIINEGSFLPVVTGIDAPTEGLDAAPPLLGYLSTTEKPTARTLLRIGEERDPLLATWQAGLGRAVAWTSDAAPRWSAGWISWERYATFWADVAKSTFPAAPDPRFSVGAHATSDGLHLQVDSADTLAAETTGTATVTYPDGTRREIELTRTDLSTFAADLPGGPEGIYSVAVRLQRDGTDVFRDAVTAIRSYSPEYATQDGDPGYLAELAAAGGGRLDPEAATAFLAEGLAPGSSTTPLWPWLALLALLTLPADVGLRRLRLEREDWHRARAWLRRRFTRADRSAAPARSERAEGLFAARDRARSSGVGSETAPPEPGSAAPPHPAAAPPADAAPPPAPPPPGRPPRTTPPPPAARPDAGAGADHGGPDEDVGDGSSSASRLLRARRRARDEDPSSRD